MNFDSIIEKFKLPSYDVIPTISPGSIKIGNKTATAIIKFINDNFKNSNVFTPKAFKYIQNFLAKSLPGNNKNDIIDSISKCFSYRDRLDLISEIDLQLFELINFQCITGDLGAFIQKIKPSNFRQASPAKLDSIYNLIQSPNKNASIKNLTKEQLDQLSKNRAFGQNKNLQKLVLAAMGPKPVADTVFTGTSTDVLSIDIPKTEKISAAIASASAIPAIVFSESTPTKSPIATQVQVSPKKSPIATQVQPSPTIKEVQPSPTIKEVQPSPTIKEVQPSPTIKEVQPSPKKSPIAQQSQPSPRKSPLAQQSLPSPRKSPLAQQSQPLPKKTVIDNNNTDVREAIDKMKIHLDHWDSYQNDNFMMSKSKILNVGDDTISVECMLHYLSNNTTYLAEFGSQCTDTIMKHTKNAQKLDLTSIIRLSDKKDFLKDTKFYDNLHGFVMEMVDFISVDDNMKNLPIESQRKLLLNLREFIKQSLTYGTNYMDEYNVIDDKLLKGNYDLLYLMNALTFKHVNAGKSIEDLNVLHKKLIDTVNENIAIYKKIDMDKMAAADLSGNFTTMSGEFNEIIGRLGERIQLLEKERSILIENVESINKDNMLLENMVSPYTKQIVEKLRSK